MRLAFLANPPWAPTGYGTQAKYICRALQELGHEITFICNWGFSGSRITWNGMTIYPMPETAGHWKHFLKQSRADLVVSLWDIWAMPYTDFGKPWAALFPVDGYPISERMLVNIRKADYPIVYSRFGQREMEKAEVPCTYISHGIDTDVFHPGDRDEARDLLHPISRDSFLVTVVATNKGYPSRKAWPELIRGFAAFHAKYPDTWLYLHSTSDPLGPGPSGGIFLMQLAEEIGVNKAVAIAHEGGLAAGVSDETMAAFYRGSDVLLSPSMAEGFGLPIMEAQACGCPVVTQACSSMTELTVNGVAIEPMQPWWVPGLDYWWQLPSVERIARGLETVYRWGKRKRHQMSKKGVEFVRRGFSWPVVIERWREFLERVERDIHTGVVG